MSKVGKKNSRFQIFGPNVLLITGIDGSGKTTLARQLVNDLNRKGVAYKYVHANEVPFLMRIVKFVIKHSFLAKENAFENYASYVHRKMQLSNKHPVLSCLYYWLLIIDYWPQVFLKVTLPLLLGKKLIIDRYVHDVMINLGLNLNFPISRYSKEINRFYKLFPKPDLSILLYVPEEIAFIRKDDVPSVEFLRERRRIYHHLSRLEGMHLVKGSAGPEELSRQIQERILRPLL